MLTAKKPFLSKEELAALRELSNLFPEFKLQLPQKLDPVSEDYGAAVTAATIARNGRSMTSYGTMSLERKQEPQKARITKAYDFSSSNIHDEDLPEYCPKPEEDNHRYSLNLRDNAISIAGLEKLTQLNLKNLQSINLAYNPIDITNENLPLFSAFCLALSESNIQELDLSGVKLGDSGFQCLVNALLAHNYGLISLKLTNIGITSSSVNSIIDLLNHPTLSSLVLNKNLLSAADKERLVTAHQQHPNLTLDLSHVFGAYPCIFKAQDIDHRAPSPLSNAGISA